MTKKSFLYAAILGLSLATQLAANSTYLGVPGNSGRERQNTVTKGRVEEIVDAGLADCTVPVELTAVSGTSTPMSVTGYAALAAGTTTSSYSGPITVTISNSGANANRMVAWVSLTPTALGDTQTAKGMTTIVQYGSTSFRVMPRSNMTVHVRGITGTAAYDVTFCNN